MRHSPGPFHEGELAVQRATGELDTGASNGRIIVRRIIPNAVGYIARQQLAIMATIDAAGQPWASALVGPAGSFTVPDLDHVALERPAARPDDPLWDNLGGDPRVGLLFLEVGSRRRYRVNGQVDDPVADPLVVEVSEAFPNCPRYIQRRQVAVEPAGAGSSTEVGTRLGDAERRTIAAADTFFIASANPGGDLDASHRGGRPGFVEITDDGLWIPDYPGNGMFNTLGNLAVYPPAGLLFIDFAASESLQLTGTTALDLTTGAPDRATGGSGRGWTFTPTRWRRAPLAATVSAEFVDYSPHNP